MNKPHLHRSNGLWFCGEYNRKGQFNWCCAHSPMEAYRLWNKEREQVAAAGIYWAIYEFGSRRDYIARRSA